MPTDVACSTPSVTLSPSILAAFQRFQDSVLSHLSRASSPAFDLVRTETELLDVAHACVLSVLPEILLSTKPIPDTVVVNDITYQRMAEPSLGTYFSLHGQFSLYRYLYRQVRVHNGPTLVPLDLQTGIVDGRWTPKAITAAAHFLQDEPSRDAIQSCQVAGILPYGRCTIERAGQQLAEHWLEHQDELKTQLMNEMVIPEEARAVAVSVDRVSLPMVESREDGKPGQQIRWRMAYCGIWTLYNKVGTAVYSRRYGYMPEGGQERIETSLRGDLEALLGKRPDLKVVALADGAAEMQNILERIVREVIDIKRGTLDYWHVIEKLAGAAKACKKIKRILMLSRNH